MITTLSLSSAQFSAVICYCDGRWPIEKNKTDCSLEAINTLHARDSCGFWGHSTFESSSCVCEHTHMTFLIRAANNNFVLERTHAHLSRQFSRTKQKCYRTSHFEIFLYFFFKYTLDSNCRSTKPHPE